jgi:hypothetical protein
MKQTVVIAELVKKRSSLIAEIIEAERALAAKRTAIGQLDAAIKIFAPDFDLGAIRPPPRSAVDPARSARVA